MTANLPVHSHTMNHGHGLTRVNQPTGAHNSHWHIEYFDSAGTRTGTGNNWSLGSVTYQLNWNAPRYAWAIRQSLSFTITNHTGNTGSTGNGTSFSNEPPFLDAIPYIRIK